MTYPSLVSSVVVSLLLARCCCLDAAERQDCPSSACPTPHESLDLSPLQGSWEVVYFTESELGVSEPRFFNLSVCGSVDYGGPASHCQDSSVCYSQLLDRYYSLGSTDSCQYSYSDREVKLFYTYSSDASSVFGHGNVTITLVCGRSLGVPEVVAGDPSDHSIEILWITSAACKTDSDLAAGPETKCYTLRAYKDDGVKAKMIDLSNLIRTSGYEVVHPENKQAKFIVGVCRPIQSGTYPQCNGAMACLVETDPGFDLGGATVPLKLASIDDEETRLEIESDFPTVRYRGQEAATGCDDKRKVKVIYLCPTGSEDLGPTISYLDNRLCLVVVSWYTYYACGTDAVQSTGCTLTSANGQLFDLTGLSANLMQVNGTSPDKHDYTYAIQLCSGDRVNTQCGILDSNEVRVAQIDYQNHGVCRSLGGGDGKLRYADGSLSLTYEMGESCHSNFHRTSIINFVCPEDVKEAPETNELRFLSEDKCLYEFEWSTPLACGSETSGVQGCQFEQNGNEYNFAPLLGESDKNWVAVDEEEDIECFMVNPCGQLVVTEDSRSAADYCNDRVAPKSGCVGCSVCQIGKDGSTKCIGTFNLQNSYSFLSVDENVVTVRGNSSSSGGSDSGPVAVMHYVCKTGDFSTPPVFVDVTNDRFYEFHWMTVAACPLGIHVGDKCTVQHESTGYVFNISSLSSTQFSFVTDDDHYHYEVSVCTQLNHSCHSSSSSGACQHYDSHWRSMGESNTALTYSDGTLFLQYRNGDPCDSGGTRNTTVLLECDSLAHKPSIAAVNEVNHCEYAVELHTKLACPPAFRATECVHFDQGGHTYDFSELARSVGNWQAEGPDGAIYYLNLCQPLNRVAGCSPLSAVCRAKSSGGKTEYTDVGSASSATFSVVGESGEETKSRVVLTYSSDSPHMSTCSKIYSRVEFICNPSAEPESGPVFQSGGDEANMCEYSFTWETPGACPVQPAHSSSCSVRDSESGRLYDLSPLGEQQNYYTVTSDDGKYSWDISVCGGLNYTCHSSSSSQSPQPSPNSSVCQLYDEHQRISGLLSSRRLQFFDGSLSMRLSGGDKCGNGHNRSTLINFECDRAVLVGKPRYIEEVDCEYSFEWPTLLACPHKELECVADGGRYDLRPLLHYQNWMVTTSGEYNIAVGGCSALNFEALSHCPQEPGMGACMFPSTGSEPGKALGYLMGDIVEEVTGVLRLSYYNGAKCEGSGRSHVVNIFFQCEQGSGAGVPIERDTDEATCVTNIDWLTQYACPLDAVNPSGWNITNPVTHQNFDLRTLSPSLSQIYVDDMISYNYTVGLAGHQIECGASGKDYNNPIGACQTRVDSGKSYILGRLNISLRFVGEELRVEYRNGNFCHHVDAPRRTVLTFVCNQTAPKTGYLEVLPEEACEYTFNVHTPKACPKKTVSPVECYAPGYASLSSLVSQRNPPIPIVGEKGIGTAYLAVCGPISTDNQMVAVASSMCPSGAAACLVLDGKPLSLGEAKSPPSLLRGGGGVVLEYTNGSKCKEGVRWSSSLILTCDKDVPIGIPEALLGSDKCSYTFTWHTALACPIEIVSTDATDNICALNDPEGNTPFVFRSIASQEVSVPDSSTKYYVQLCGTVTKPTASCGPNVGICRMDGNGATETLVHALHKYVIVSHAPHIFEVVYNNGTACGVGNRWTAVVTMVCKWKGGTNGPVLVSAIDCNLQFLWKSSLFCNGHETCAAEDKDSGYVYDLDGLLSDTWSGLVQGKGGRFDLGVCRSLNPFSPGPHCSSPAGICWHKTEKEHINLGHMTGPPVYIGGNYPHIQLNYTGGDDCSEGVAGQKHSTTVSLTCGPGTSTPLSLESSGPCTHTLDWESPYACRPTINYTAACVWNDSVSGLHYNLSSLAKPTTVDTGGQSVELCLCPSPACAAWGGAGVTLHPSSQSWGKFSKLSVSSANSGPIISYTDGAICTGNTKYKTTIYMECDRSITTDDSKPHFQDSMSGSCSKVLFWPTPYACRSEHTSCIHAAGNKFYDFTPLHANTGEKAWRIQHSGDEYYVNLCGSIPEYTGCDPNAAVCLYTSKGEWQNLGMASTQEIVGTTDNHIQIKFNGGKMCRDSYSHVNIDMACGLDGLKFSSNEENSCTYDFTWSTPYACHVDDTIHRSLRCDDMGSSETDGLIFLPNKLKNSDGFSVAVPGYGTFYVSVCGQNSHCSHDVSVCYNDYSVTHDVASYTHQTIMTQGTLMWIEMNSTDGLYHTILNVECVDDSADINRAETMEFVKVTTSNIRSNTHTFYHFNIWTSTACSFSTPTEAPPTPSDHHKSDGGDHSGSSGGSGSSHSGSSSSVVALVVTLVVLVIAAIVLGFVFYKKERRDRVFKFFMNKSSESVKYEKLPMSRTEETALLEDGSSGGSDGGEGSGEEGEGEEEKEGGKGRRSADQDEELIDL